MILAAVRHEVKKKQRKHDKLLFNLIIKEDGIFISSKCRDLTEPVLTNIETIINPYLEPDDKKEFRRIIKSIYYNKLKGAS